MWGVGLKVVEGFFFKKRPLLTIGDFRVGDTRGVFGIEVRAEFDIRPICGPGV